MGDRGDGLRPARPGGRGGGDLRWGQRPCPHRVGRFGRRFRKAPPQAQALGVVEVGDRVREPERVGPRLRRVGVGARRQRQRARERVEHDRDVDPDGGRAQQARRPQRPDAGVAVRDHQRVAAEPVAELGQQRAAAGTGAPGQLQLDRPPGRGEQRRRRGRELAEQAVVEASRSAGRLRDQRQAGPVLRPSRPATQVRGDVGIEQPRRGWLPQLGLGRARDPPAPERARRPGRRAQRPPPQPGGDGRGRRAWMRVVVEVAEHRCQPGVDVGRGEQRQQLAVLTRQTECVRQPAPRGVGVDLGLGAGQDLGIADRPAIQRLAASRLRQDRVDRAVQPVCAAHLPARARLLDAQPRGQPDPAQPHGGRVHSDHRPQRRVGLDVVHPQPHRVVAGREVRRRPEADVAPRAHPLARVGCPACAS